MSKSLLDLLCDAGRACLYSSSSNNIQIIFFIYKCDGDIESVMTLDELGKIDRFYRLKCSVKVNRLMGDISWYVEENCIYHK